jgi:ABC-type nitrate/sulfonate/bicarbonate transport systems, periplasmic components
VNGWAKNLGAALAGVAMTLCATAADAADQLTVRMDFIPWGTHAAMHLAQVKGWFEEAGLEVDIQDGTGSANTIQLVAAGQADVGQVQLGVMAVAKEQGADLTSIAGWFRKSDLAVLVDRDSDIKTGADLKGKSIVNFNGSPWSPYIPSYLKAVGLSEGDVDIVAVAPAALMSTYTAKQADTVMTTAPFGLPIIESSRPSRAILMADAGIAFPSYGLIVRNDTLTAKKDALKRLVEVEVKAWEYIYDGHIDEGVEAIIANRPGMKLDPTVLAKQIELYKDFIFTSSSEGKPFGVQTEADWAKALADMQKAGIVAAERDPHDYFTNELVAQ